MDSAAQEDASSSLNVSLDSDNTEAKRAQEAALKLIARAEQSCTALSKKLRQRGFSNAAVQEVIQSLMESDMLNDERYARLWAASRLLHKAESPCSLTMRLMVKGIGNKIAKQAVASVIKAEDETAILERYIAQYLKKNGENPPQRLLRQEGFSSIAIEEFTDNTAF